MTKKEMLEDIACILNYDGNLEALDRTLTKLKYEDYDSASRNAMQKYVTYHKTKLKEWKEQKVNVEDSDLGYLFVNIFGLAYEVEAIK